MVMAVVKAAKAMPSVEVKEATPPDSGWNLCNLLLGGRMHALR